MYGLGDALQEAERDARRWKAIALSLFTIDVIVILAAVFVR